MLLIAYLAVKAMLLLIDCKYRCCEMINHDQFSMKQPLMASSGSGNNSGSTTPTERSSDNSKESIKKKKNLRKNYSDDNEFDTGSISYGTVGKMAFGKWGGYTVDAAIFWGVIFLFLSQLK